MVIIMMIIIIAINSCSYLLAMPAWGVWGGGKRDALRRNAMRCDATRRDVMRRGAT